jgi:hypothetical protein
MNTKKPLHFSLTAQAIVSDFFHDLSPFFTGDIKRLFVSYLKAHNTNNILTYWQRSLINNFFEKKFFDNQSHLPEFKKGFHDVYRLQKEWIQVHNLLLNYYTTSGKKIVEAEGFFNVNECIMGNRREVYRSFFPQPIMPSFHETFQRLSITNLNARLVLEQKNPSLVFSTKPKLPILSLSDSILFGNTKKLEEITLVEEKRRDDKKHSIKLVCTKKTFAFN